MEVEFIPLESQAEESIFCFAALSVEVTLRRPIRYFVLQS